ESSFPARHAFRGIETIYPVPFLGQMYGGASRYPPDPTPGVCKPLRFRKVRFTGPKGLLGPLLFTQIEHESDTFVPAAFEECTAEQYGHSAAVFPEVLLLERLEDPARL